MTPAEYVQKRPSVTAVQWDGSDSSAEWILSVYSGAQKAGDDLVVKDAMDRDVPLERGVWVLQDPMLGMVNLIEDSDFTTKYEPES